MDEKIVASVQTADPNRRGGYATNIAIGANVLFQHGHRLGFELTASVEQSFDGPQLVTEWSAIFGHQNAF